LRDFEDGWNVVAKIQFLQGSLDVFARYGLFGVFFGDLVGLGGDKGDELNAAFYQEVARIFGKCHARLAGEDVLDDLLDGRFGQRQVVVAAKLAVRHGGGMRGSSMVLALSFRSARGCSSPAK
jgi:hypothetical protein